MIIKSDKHDKIELPLFISIQLMLCSELKFQTNNAFQGVGLVHPLKMTALLESVHHTVHSLTKTQSWLSCP